MLLRLLLLFLAADAFAATAYDVRRGNTTVSVVAEGGQMRADLQVPEGAPVTHTSVLWRGGAVAIALNARNETWYELAPEPLSLRSRYLGPFPAKGAKKVRWTMSEANGTYTARLTYDVHVREATVRCSADYTIETTDRHPRTLWLGRIFARTGLPEVDAELAAAEAAITRFPTRLTMTATRQYVGGPPMSETLVVETLNVRETTVDPGTFVRPAQYVAQKPVIGAPGR